MILFRIGFLAGSLSTMLLTIMLPSRQGFESIAAFWICYVLYEFLGIVQVIQEEREKRRERESAP